MKYKPLALSLLTAMLIAPAPQWTAPAQAAEAQFIRTQNGVQEYRLDNGLKVLLVENHAAPVVSVNIVYRVGSRNEASGYTGSTHFLEHMLFKGTPTFNKDKGTQIAQSLMEQGSRFNATTWLDRTNYFETLPSGQLDLALRLEADRMRNSFIADADRQSEMSVVRNELERGENNPGRVMWQNLFSAAYKAHPYRTPTIGWNEDVENVPTARLKKFYQDFYYPNNATLIVVGDLNVESALKQIKKYFGPIKASENPIPTVYTQEPPQQGERRFTLNRPGQLGIVNMAFHTPPMEHTDSAPLDILSGILSTGVSSRLHQALVEKNKAVDASTWNAPLRDPGLFIVTAELTEGTAHSDAEKLLLAELEKMKAKAPTEAEMTRVRNQLLANFAFEKHGTYELSSALSEMEASADWRFLYTYPERLKRVTAADVQRVAQTYLKDYNRTVGWFVPQKVEAVETNVRNLTYPEGQTTKPAAQQASQASTVLNELALGNQGKLLIQENHLDNTVAIRANLLAGEINDPVGKAGLAELTAEMLERGTQKRSKIDVANALDSMGSEIHFNAELERVEISARSLSENIESTLDLLFEMLKSPAFDSAEFDKLKTQRLNEMKKDLDNTDTQASEQLYQALYPSSHPYHLSTADKIAQIEKLTIKDVKTFYTNHYGNHEMIFTVVGDVETPKITQWVRLAMDKWQGQNPSAVVIPDIAFAHTPGKIVKTMKDKANVSIALGRPADLKQGDKDYFAAELANHALGRSSLSSRLGLRVRDELGLTYGIYSYFPKIGRGAGPWFVGVTTNPENVQKTLDATKEVIAKYRKEGISQREFEIAKSSMIGSYLVTLTTNPQIADRLTDAVFYNLGSDYLKDRAKQIESVSKAEVNRMIQKYFDPAQLTVSIAGNYEEQQ